MWRLCTSRGNGIFAFLIYLYYNSWPTSNRYPLQTQIWAFLLLNFPKHCWNLLFLRVSWCLMTKITFSKALVINNAKLSSPHNGKTYSHSNNMVSIYELWVEINICPQVAYYYLHYVFRPILIILRCNCVLIQDWLIMIGGNKICPQVATLWLSANIDQPQILELFLLMLRHHMEVEARLADAILMNHVAVWR